MLEKIGKGQYIALKSYKKNGEGKITPVWVCLLENRIYVSTSAESWKVKRIRRNGQIAICSSNATGKPKSAWIDAQAVIREEAPLKEKVKQAMVKKYRLQYRLIRFLERLSGSQASDVVIEITA